jgi:superfamily II DNA or RNA helicase
VKTLEPYQTAAMEWMLNRRKGIVKVPAGGGKTTLASAYLNFCAECRDPLGPKLKVGWLAPTVETRDQALAAMREFPLLAKQDIKAACAAAGVDMSDRDILIVDECKHATAESWFKTVQQCPVRFGLDATPFYEGQPDRNRALELMFGEQIFEVKREDVKRLVQAKVLMLDASDPVKEKIDAEIKALLDVRKRQMRGLRFTEGELFSMCAWQAVAQIGIAQNQARNAAAIALARKHALAAECVLVLINQVEHGELLVKSIPSAILVHSKLGKRARQAALDSIRSGHNRCLIATSLADEGLDLPMLNVLIMVSGGRSKIKAEQRTGRVLRAFAGKNEGLIYDFKDECHSVMANQSRKRVALYKSLGYQVENYGGVI